MSKDELCPKCFTVIGSPNRYKLVRILADSIYPLSVSDLTRTIGLTQPTVTHHLKILDSIGALILKIDGNRRLYTLNKNSHCFKECNIAFK